MEIKMIDLPMIAVIGKEGLCTAEKNMVAVMAGSQFSF